MLRHSIVTARQGNCLLLSRASFGAQAQKRFLADNQKPPQSSAVTKPSPTAPILSSQDSKVPPPNAPVQVQQASGAKQQTSPPITIPPSRFDGAQTASRPTPPPPTPKKRFWRLRNTILALTLLSALGFGGGVWYSLVSDNFHDFFTEYVPFGEEAVLYFEEREFRKRFPNALNRQTKDSGAKVTIPTKSGLSWKVAESEKGSNLETKGPHMSAVGQGAPASVPQKAVSPPPVAERPAPKKEPQSKAAPPAPAPQASIMPPKQQEAKVASTPSSAPLTRGKKSPEVDEPSVFTPISRVDPIKIDNADEPLVQDLVKMLNDIIVVVNADRAAGRFNSTLSKAKSELAAVGQRIIQLKDVEKKAASEAIKTTHTEFDTAARELVRRLEEEMHIQEGRWRDEFESERERLSSDYEKRLSTEIELSKKISIQEIENKLVEQALALKKEFATGIKDRVEKERDGRLSRLVELSENVQELQKLTNAWNSVLERNLKTQHLQVAVEAVRSSLEEADRPRPFIRELAALKEIAADDPVVDTAIASINPMAYQLGIPTSGQIIDRFRRVAQEVRKTSLLPQNAGVASHMASNVLSNVMFKKRGRVVGDDAESVLTRTETLLEEGNLDDAAREMNTLEGWAKALSKDWLGEVRRVLEVRQALEVISAGARLESLKVD